MVKVNTVPSWKPYFYLWPQTFLGDWLKEVEETDVTWDNLDDVLAELQVSGTSWIPYCKVIYLIITFSHSCISKYRDYLMIIFLMCYVLVLSTFTALRIFGHYCTSLIRSRQWSAYQCRSVPQKHCLMKWIMITRWVSKLSCGLIFWKLYILYIHIVKRED